MIFVDNANIRAQIGRSVKCWCHLVAVPEDKKELLAFGISIGLNPTWLQEPSDGVIHFDITANKRSKAISAGAKFLPKRDLVRLLQLCHNTDKRKIESIK